MRMLWPLKGESTLQKQPPKGVLQICVWQLLLKLIKNVYEGVKFFKKSNKHLFSYIVRGLHISCKTVMLRSSFSLKYLLMATGALQGYVCLRK